MRNLAADIIAVGKQETSTFSAAVVDSVTPKGDGTNIVTMTWQLGTGLPVNSYVASYTPVVGHVVLIARYENQTVILGHLIPAF